MAQHYNVDKDLFLHSLVDSLIDTVVSIIKRIRILT